MSVIIDATYEGKTFEVEISHDGSLEFLDYDIEYDQAAAEFGYPVTVAMKLLEAWNLDPVEVIVKRMDMPIRYIAHLAMDWAEHVSDAYAVYGYDKRGGADKLVSILNSARRQIGLAEGEISKYNLLNLQALVSGAYDKVGEHHDVAAKSAAWATRYALSVFPASESINDKEWAARDQAASAARNAIGAKAEYVNLVWVVDEEKEKAETLWQIRRLVDCMEAVGQGFDWPDMKATP